MPSRGSVARRNGFIQCRGGRVFGQPSGPQDRMQRTKLEIPFGHAFDSHGYCCPKALRVGSPSVFDQPSRSAPRSGIPARLAQNGVCDRDNHVRKSRSQCTDPDAGHSRDDRGRDDGAHRDADTPKAIGFTLIDAVCDQHHSQP